MQVSKWGNSLAIRIPAEVAEALGLEEGDEVGIEVTKNGVFRLGRDRTREEALKKLQSLGWKLPPGWKFNRDEANER
jgi:antitoxin MazE